MQPISSNYLKVPAAMDIPSKVEVPRPSSSIIIKEFLVALLIIFFVYSI